MEENVLVGYIFAGISELMDNTILDFRLGKYSFNGSGKPGQIIRAGDENVLTP